jgi:hypothetical protein
MIVQNGDGTINTKTFGSCQSRLDALYKQITGTNALLKKNPMALFVKTCMDNAVKETDSCTLAVKEAYDSCFRLIKPVLKDMVMTKKLINANYMPN